MQYEVVHSTSTSERCFKNGLKHKPYKNSRALGEELLLFEVGIKTALGIVHVSKFNL